MRNGLVAPQDPVRLRDAALRRISSTRRWMILAAAGLTAGFAALVSAILPGKSLGAKSATVATTASRSAATSATTPPLPAPASAAQLGIGSTASSPSISPPSAAPQPAPAPSAPAQSAPAQSAPAPSVAPAPSGGGAAVSGGS